MTFLSVLSVGGLNGANKDNFEAMNAVAKEAGASRLAGMLSTNQVKLLEPEPQPVRAKTNAMVSTTAEKRIRECFKKMRSL